jgi:2-phospho-L-lactate guanylyltransferase
VRTVAVLPVKRFGAAKQRLAREDRADVMRAMAGEVLAALAGAGVAGRLVVTSDPVAVRLAEAVGATVVPEPGLLGHSGAAALGIEHALALGADRVLLLAGDCPLLTAADIDGLLARHDGEGVVVVADRHGTGTNALLLCPPRAIEPAFGTGSRVRHERLAAEAGLDCAVEHVPAFALDVDTVDDLAAVARVRALSA